MMRRYGIILLLLAQISLLLWFAWQFQLGEKDSEKINLITEDKWSMDQEGYSLTDDVYLDFAINFIDKDVVAGEPTYGDRLYVLLSEQDGFHQVKRASTANLQPRDDEIKLVGKYMYDEPDVYYVEYGFEYVESINQYGDFMGEDILKVTMQYGSTWNRYKVQHIEKTAK